eukprot:CAMPEP_0184487792 /NCGR_PEP_ID=MMETSP0113_2-20130426/10336_1 /TAXON_ID=91329 /ORGANISM="Norrisiella sphaerica, Strain BC52" /LENGTH=262 /DNA_ID=CAMNT_0026870199 /DNA_START=34 /DNA_END=822 /DNA_ORIENTATION=+
MTTLEPENKGLPPQEKQTIKSVSIPSHKIIDGNVHYVVQVQGAFNAWCVLKRYSAFEEAHKEFMDSFKTSFPSGAVFPPKKLKLFQSHTSPEFIEERRVLLENYLRKLVAVKNLAQHSILTGFLTRGKQKLEVKEKQETMPEDVEITDVSIPATRIMSDHVLYQVDLANDKKRKTYSKWCVLKRFTQIWEMDQKLRASLADDIDALMTLPPAPQRKAKLLHDHMDPSFIESRRILLENYLKKLIKCHVAIRSLIVLEFLGVQ